MWRRSAGCADAVEAVKASVRTVQNITSVFIDEVSARWICSLTQQPEDMFRIMLAGSSGSPDVGGVRGV
jgi:hypothetical protein